MTHSSGTASSGRARSDRPSRRRALAVSIGLISVGLVATSVNVATSQAAQPASTPRSVPTTITAGTFNINNGKVVLGKSNRRLDGLAQEMLRANYDVFGIQEASPEMRDRLMARFHNKYAYADVANVKNVNKTAQQIFFRRDMFQAGQILGTIPIGYNSWAIYQDLYNVNTGSHFIYVTAHLAGLGGRANSDKRLAQTKVMISVVRNANSAGLPVVYSGDMNSHGASKYVYDAPRRVFLANGYSDVFNRAPVRVNARFNSFNALNRNPAMGGYRPDQIYVDGGTSVARAETMVRLVKTKVKVKGKTKTKTVRRYKTPFISDHNPIRAVITLPAQ